MTSKPDNANQYQSKGGQAKTSNVAATMVKFLKSQAPKRQPK